MLRFTAKHLDKHSKKANHKILIDTKANFDYIISADLSNKATKPVKKINYPYSFAWVMPPPGKGSGGHLTIYRFMKYLEDAGHHCTIYVYTNTKELGSIKTLKQIMGNDFPNLKANMIWINKFSQINQHDGIFATSWETAYVVYQYPYTTKKFYFVQDFEPYFYPKGSLYTLAENTYKMGFYGVTAGKWLTKTLKENYNMRADYFNFGADNQYKYINNKPRHEIMFYVRPYTERRGLELGILALYIFHQKHPNYKINFIGWDMSNYKIPFDYVNHGILNTNQLNNLYNKCLAGLILSFTNVSLMPLEILKAGVIPVVNKGENNELVIDNKYIKFTNSDPQSIANTLFDIISNPEKEQLTKTASDSVKSFNWNDSGKEFLKIIDREMKNNNF